MQTETDLCPAQCDVLHVLPEDCALLLDEEELYVCFTPVFLVIYRFTDLP